MYEDVLVTSKNAPQYMIQKLFGQLCVELWTMLKLTSYYKPMPCPSQLMFLLETRRPLFRPAPWGSRSLHLSSCILPMLFLFLSPISWIWYFPRIFGFLNLSLNVTFASDQRVSNRSELPSNDYFKTIAITST